MRNKLSWDYCARCGETLGEQTVVTGKATAPARGAAPVGGPAGDLAPGPSVAPLVVGALVLVAGAAYWAMRTPPPAPAEVPSNLVSVATTPPTTPVGATPAPKPAGQAQFEEGRRLLISGNVAEATRLLGEAVSEAPTNAEYRNFYGKALLRVPDMDRAIAQLTEATRLDPQSFPYAADLARGLDRAGRTEDAAGAYDRALAMQEDVQLMRDAATLYLRTGNPAKAAPLLRTVAQRQPEDLVLQQTLGQALEGAGDPQGAAQVYRGLLARMPGAEITRGLLAEIYFKEGQRDEAIALFREGIALNPGSPLMHRGLASILERSGQLAEAAAAYREYARLAPGAPDAQQLADRAARIERRIGSS